MLVSPHQCFSREVLADFQLGKLDQKQILVVGSEIEQCPTCQAALALLDEIEDEVLSGLRGSQNDSLSSSDSGLSSTRSWSQRNSVEFGETDSPQPVAGMASESTRVVRALGQYLLEEEIGRGGMGTVWRARHKSMNRLVAIKLLPVERLNGRESVARFFREMEAAGRLIHPHLVHAYDAGEIAGQPYLTMELLHGTNFNDLVRNTGPLTVAEACELIRQAALGLAHAHDNLSVHRDVKPSNLFLTEAGIVKVLDLGLTKLVDAPEEVGVITDKQQILGTPAYMSPEQFRDPHSVGTATDIYSLGCSLFYLLVGQPPFFEQKPAGVIEMALVHASIAPPKLRTYNEEIPAKLAALFDKMLAKSPAERPGSMSEVAAALAPFCKNGPELLQERLRKVALGYSSREPVGLLITSGGAIASPRRRVLLTCVTGMIVLLSLGGWFVVGKMHSSADWLRREFWSNTLGRENRGLTAGAAGGVFAGSPQQTEDVQQAIRQFELSVPLRDSAAEVVRQHPGSDHWSGKAETTLFAVRVLPVPAGARGAILAPKILSQALVQATHDLLKTGSLLKRYRDSGLDDATALQTAFLRLANDTQWTGQIHSLSQHARREGNSAVAMVYADETSLVASMTTTASTQAVQAAYREVIHEQSRELMARKQWEEALQLWQHLHQRKLVTADLYLDAARCFHAMGKNEDALLVLEETLDLFAEQARWELLEQAGELALQLDSEQATAVAQRAFELALKRFQKPTE